MIRIAENLFRQPASQPSLKLVMSEAINFREYLTIRNVQAGTYNLFYDIKTDNGASINLHFGLGGDRYLSVDNVSWRWNETQNKGEITAELIVEQSFLDANPDNPHLWVRYRNERVATTMVSKGLRIHREGEMSDIWTPAHANLTPAQIAMLPPYGDYKEIKSF